MAGPARGHWSRWLAGASVAKSQGRLDQGRVGEGLGKIAQVMMGEGVHLFCVESDRTGQRDEIVEQ